MAYLESLLIAEVSDGMIWTLSFRVELDKSEM